MQQAITWQYVFALLRPFIKLPKQKEQHELASNKTLKNMYDA
jgi:hypothetical protein